MPSTNTNTNTYTYTNINTLTHHPPYPSLSGTHHKVALPGSKEEEEAIRKKKKGRPKKQPLPDSVLAMDY